MYEYADHRFDKMYDMLEEAKTRGISFRQIVLWMGEAPGEKRLYKILFRMRSADKINGCKLDFLVRFIAVYLKNYEKIELNTLLNLSQQTRLWVISLTRKKRDASRLIPSRDLQLKSVTKVLTKRDESRELLANRLVDFLEAAPGGEALLEIGEDFLPLFARIFLDYLLP